jgi:hypothetical protein
MQSMVIDSNVYYNLRKRYGMGPARAVMHAWNYYHVEEPVNADEAVYYYLLGDDAYESR